MPISPRHPYAGEYVFTAFSGSHQDAIAKGMKYQADNKSTKWNIPYLPIDPADVGRQYEPIIRINSQSGKGGIAYILESKYGIRIPDEKKEEFGYFIKGISDKIGRELTAEEIYEYMQKYFQKSNNKNGNNVPR